MSHTSDIDLATIAAAFGLAPDICAHDAIACINAKIANAASDSVRQLLSTLGDNAECGHPYGCRLRYKIKRDDISRLDDFKCVACEAEKRAMRAVLFSVLAVVTQSMEQNEIKPDIDGDLDEILARIGYHRNSDLGAE